jgi:hypothetical protein
MDAAEKGARYAKIFRKAGALLAKGRIARAAPRLKRAALSPNSRAIARWSVASPPKSNAPIHRRQALKISPIVLPHCAACGRP